MPQDALPMAQDALPMAQEGSIFTQLATQFLTQRSELDEVKGVGHSRMWYEHLVRRKWRKRDQKQAKKTLEARKREIKALKEKFLKQRRSSRKMKKKLKEASDQIIWNSFTLTGAFRARSLVLFVLNQLGFKYDARRRATTNFIFAGQPHSRDRSITTYYNYKVGPGQNLIDMREGFAKFEKILFAAKTNPYRLGIPIFKKQIREESFAGGNIIACSGDWQVKYPKVYYALISFEVLWECQLGPPIKRHYYQTLFNLVNRSYHHGRLECFYEEGDNEWYVGYIILLGTSGYGGISVHFTDYAYPTPSSLNPAILRRPCDEEEEVEEVDYIKQPHKKRSKF